MKNGIKIGLFVADTHYPYHDPVVISIINQVARDLKPDILGLVGDMFDAEGISKFTIKDYEDGIFDTMREIQGYRKDIFIPMLEACNRKNLEVLWSLGNHDGRRITETLEKAKAKCHADKYRIFSEGLDVRKIFPEAKIKDYNDCHKIGHLFMTHGEYHNEAHAKKHVTIYGANVLYGHLHTHDAKTVHSKAKNKVRTGYSMPCSCRLGYGYMRNRSSYWVNGFAVGYFFPDGSFNLYMVNIINGKCIFNGKPYYGRRK